MPDILAQERIRPSTPICDGDWTRARESVYSYESGGHRLSRNVRGITGGQLASFQRGECELALVLHEPLLVLCSRFGDDLLWSAATFHWQQLPRDGRARPPAPGPSESGALLTASLVEAGDNRVVARRELALTPVFTRALHETILEQARYPYDPISERRALEGLHRRCPGMGGLVAYATIRMKAS